METDNRPLHVELIKIIEAGVRRHLGIVEKFIDQHNMLRSLDKKKAQSIFREEDIARLLTLKTELRELLQEAAWASENGLTETAEKVDANLRSLQCRYDDLLKENL